MQVMLVRTRRLPTNSTIFWKNELQHLQVDLSLTPKKTRIQPTLKISNCVGFKDLASYVCRKAVTLKGVINLYNCQKTGT